MIREDELLKAIEDCERLPPSYQNCEKLATFYTLYDHLFGCPPFYDDCKNSNHENIISAPPKSEFLEAINGKNITPILNILDELAGSLHVVNPKLYDSLIRKINEL